MVTSLLMVGLLSAPAGPAALVIPQALSARESASIDLLRSSGADVRVEQPLEVWVDFNNALTDDHLKPITGMRNLTALRVLHEGITNKGLDHIRDVPRLWLLVIISKKVDDVGTEKVSRIKTLTKLDFIGATLTTKGIRNLTKLPKLEQLYLYSAHVTDEALKPLGGMKTLKILDLPKTIKPQTIEWLRKALPTTAIKQI